MDDKKLFNLGIIAAVMVVLAIVVSRPKDNSSNDIAPNTPLIQGLATDTIAAIELEGVGKKARIVKSGDGFVVESRENYPALFSEVNNLIVSCLDLKISDFVTANSDNYADLGVMESSADRLVKFYDDQEKLITGIVVGKRDQTSGGTYVRKLNPDSKVASKVYLASKVGWINTNPASYVEKRILECQREDIQLVKVSAAGSNYSIAGVKADEKVTPELQVPVPAGMKLKQSVVESVFDAAKNISFTDVKSVAKSDPGLKFDTEYVVLTADQTELTLKFAKGTEGGAEKYFVKCSSKYTNKEFMDKVRAGNLQITSDKKSMEDADQNLQAYQAVEDFNNRHSNWVYIMEPYQATKMIKNLDDMFEKIEQEQDTQNAPAGSAAQ